jgi:hypothetical protein
MKRVLKALSLFQTPFLTFCAILISAAPVCSEAPQWSGSIKSLNIYGEEAPAGLFPDYRLSSNRVRLDMDWQLDRAWQLEAALDYQYLWRDPKSAFSLPKKTYNRIRNQPLACRRKLTTVTLIWKKTGNMAITLPAFFRSTD